VWRKVLIISEVIGIEIQRERIVTNLPSTYQQTMPSKKENLMFVEALVKTFPPINSASSNLFLIKKDYEV
jgi:hypothetical protein